MFNATRGAAPSWLGQEGSFPNPWEDVASLHFPITIPLVLRWCELIASGDGSYTRALDRVMSYFLTDIELDGVSDDAKENWQDYLGQTLYLPNFLHSAGLDAQVYGNSFVSVLHGFRRHLVCGRCKRVERPLAEIAAQKQFYEYQWSNFQFVARCPHCKYRGPWTRVDKKASEKEACILKRWSPHQIEILWDPYSDQTAYIWKIPADYQRMIREGKLFMLERAHWEIVEAVQANCHLRFEPDMIYHWREDALAGIINRGWGIPRMLSNFRQSWYVQVLRRYNEAIALDYIMPMRVLSPEPGDKKAGTDPLTNFGMGTLVGQLRRMVRRHRRDPADVHIMPFAVKYSLMGGEARQLAPVDLLKQGSDVQMANIGMPVNIWQGDLTMQAAPVGLRLFEASWTSLPRNFNGCLRFIVEHAAEILSWQQPKARLKPVTHADDIASVQAKLQLGIGGQISPSTMLETVRLNFRDEVRKMLDDQRFQAEQQARQQKEMSSAAQMEEMVASVAQGGAPGQAQQPAGPGGQAPQGQQGGGQGQQPAGPAGQAQQSVSSQLAVTDNEEITPAEMWQRADTAARQLLAMPMSQRISELRKIKQVNPNIHPMVKDRLDQLEQEAARKGKQMVMQGGGGG
jgi:hypothetical protein